MYWFSSLENFLSYTSLLKRSYRSSTAKLDAAFQSQFIASPVLLKPLKTYGEWGCFIGHTSPCASQRCHWWVAEPFVAAQVVKLLNILVLFLREFSVLYINPKKILSKHIRKIRCCLSITIYCIARTSKTFINLWRVRLLHWTYKSRCFTTLSLMSSWTFCFISSCKTAWCTGSLP